MEGKPWLRTVLSLRLYWEQQCRVHQFSHYPSSLDKENMAQPDTLRQTPTQTQDAMRTLEQNFLAYHTQDTNQHHGGIFLGSVGFPIRDYLSSALLANTSVLVHMEFMEHREDPAFILLNSRCSMFRCSNSSAVGL